MQLLKQSTAATIVVGPVLDANGVAVTTAVVTNFSIAKNGTVAALTTETVTHSVNGYYTIALTTSNTNTLGQLDVIVNASTMAMANHRYTILTAGMFDAIVTNGRLLRSTNSNSEVAVTGANHIAADVHQMQHDVITAAAIADNAITAAALASDAVTKIQSGLATTSGVTASFTEIKGAGWSSTTDTLEKIAEAGGSSTITVSIPASTAQTIADSATNKLNLIRGTTFSYQFTNIGTLTDWTKIYFTVRPIKKSADSQSLIQIVVTNPSDGADGLKYLNGAATTAAWGSITVDDVHTGDVTITLTPTATTLLAEQYDVDFDIKVIKSSAIPLIVFGKLDVKPDVTRAIT